MCFFISIPLALYAAPQYIEKHDNWDQDLLYANGSTRTPQDMVSSMWFADCDEAKALQAAMVKFNAKRPFKQVSFNSKQGDHGQETVLLKAWWLPAKSKKAPRVVVQHGNNVNSNDQTVQAAAFLLRSAGFSVLLPDLRDHGWSGKTSHGNVGWAWSYYLDTAAAWEYAVGDPDGELGGAMSKDKVAIMGFSMGGLAASTAFGVLKDAPALWLDSAVFHPKEVFQYQIGIAVMDNWIGRFIAWFTIQPAWLIARWHAGVDINGQVPEDVMATPQRSVALVHAGDDTTVPPNQVVEYKKLFEDKGYSIKGMFTPEVSNCGSTTHCDMHVMYTNHYYKMVCSFFSEAFNVSVSAQAKACNKNPVPEASRSSLVEAQDADEVDDADDAAGVPSINLEGAETSNHMTQDSVKAHSPVRKQRSRSAAKLSA